MLAEWNDLRPDGVESDPQYLAALCRHALAARRHDARAEVRDADLRADHARGAARHDGRAAVDAAVPALRRHRSRRAVHGVHRRAAAPQRAPLARRARRRGRRPGARAGDDAGPHLDAAFALRHRRPGARVGRTGPARCGCAPRRGLPARRASKGAATTPSPRRGGLFTPAMLDDVVDAADPSIAHWQLQGAKAPTAAGSCSVVGERRHQGGARRSPSALGSAVEPRSTTTILPEAIGKYRMVRPR